MSRHVARAASERLGLAVSVTEKPASAATIVLGMTQALATRLCHDLAGAVFTLTGALELVEEDAELLALAREAALVLQWRLRLLRAAWGQSEIALSHAALTSLLAGMPLGRRMTMRMDGLDPSCTLTAEQARLVFCLAMLAAESLHGEGEIGISQPEPGLLQIALNGRDAFWPDGLADLLACEEIALDAAAAAEPRTMLAPLCALQLHQTRMRLHLAPNRLTLDLS